MKRHEFLLIAAIVPGVFGSIMMLAPGLMLGNSLAITYDGATRAVAQWVGFGMFSLGVINFLSRNDPHALLTAGFLYCVVRMGPREESPAVRAAHG